MRLPIGISDFKKLITGNYFFADKTSFIEDIINDGADIILITRPRRFGKTLNLSMLHHFFDIQQANEENLFKGLNISKNQKLCNQYQNKYPVLFISFKDVKESNFEDAYNNITNLISQLYESHNYLLEDNTLSDHEKTIFNALCAKKADKSDIKNAIRQLSTYLSRKFNQPAIILIDEYDTPIQEAYLKNYYTKMVDLMRSIFGQALKDNSHLAKAILTGITRISQESMFSDLNNVNVYSLLRETYGQYFGFTETEVLDLLNKKNNGKLTDISQIKEWYNGYQVGKYTLYNPWSIINCLDNNIDLKPYWLNTSSNSLIAELLTNADSSIKQLFEDLLQGKTIHRPLSENLIFKEIKTKEAALWSLLLYAGYLKVTSSKSDGPQLIASLSIPNKEVSFAYERIITDWFTLSNKIDAYHHFIQTLINEDVDLFKQYISNYLLQSASYFDFTEKNPERIFHVFILGLVIGLRDLYDIQSNREAGFGRCDVIFIPKHKDRNGIILEFKFSETEKTLKDKAKEALNQIQIKQYNQAFKQSNTKHILCIGIAFCGKKIDLLSKKITCH